jgi:fungal nitric oxide reductase
LVHIRIKEQLIPGSLSRDEVVQNAFLLLIAGNATMVSMVTSGVVELLQNQKPFKISPK